MHRTRYPEQWLQTPEGSIRYVDIGAGEPIIFVHGLGGRIEDHEPVFPLLEGDFRLIDLDQPGSGWSSKPVREYSCEFLADFILDFASRLGIERFSVIGGSQGGLVALLMCRRAPERIKGAVVYSASGLWPARPLAARLIRALPPESARLFFRVSSLFWLSPANPEFWSNRARALEFLDSREMPGFGVHVRDCLASQFEQDYRPVFAEIQTRVLIVWGRLDAAMPVTQGRALQRLLPRARLVEAPGAGHNVDAEKPELFAGLVKDFLV